MSLKDTWTNKVNGVDKCDAKDINDIAQAVIDLEKSDTKALTTDDIIDNLTTDSNTKTLSAKQGKLLKDYVGDLIKYNHPTYGEIDYSLQEQIGNINYANPDIRKHSIVADINALHDDLLTKLSEEATVRENADNENISDIETLKNTVMHFKLAKLSPNETFNIKPNMMCFIKGSSKQKINYYNSDNTHITDGDGNNIVMASGAIISIPTNDSIENWKSWEENELDNYYRVFAIWTTGSALITSAVKAYQNLLGRNTYIKNESDDTNVWVFYLEQ